MHLDPQLVVRCHYALTHPLEGLSMLLRSKRHFDGANDPSYRRFHAWCTRLHNATVRGIEAPLEQDLLPEPLPRDLATP